MKKIILLLLLTIFTMVFTSCEPLEDIYEEVDAESTDAIVGDIEYTLTDEDYDTLELTYGSFSSEDEAKEALPGFLEDAYPVLGDKSSAVVTYQLYVGSAEGISDYTDASEYSFENTDYPSAFENAIAFYESEEASDYVPEVLATNYPDAVEGDIVLAEYSQYEGETVNGISEFYTADFQTEGTLLDFETVSIIGDQAWEETQSYGAKMSGYSGGSNENEDWLVSQEIDLANYPNATLQVNQILNYAAYDYVDILISTDYSGDVDTTTWDVIDLTNVPDGSGWDEYLSEEYSLSAYNDETVRIAFKYTSTDSAAGTWEILQVMLSAAGVEGDTASKAEYYTYGADSWELSEDVYYLSDEDFDSMGEESDQPGRYNNFSSSISPDDYLSTFLSTKYPYAQEGDALSVIYRYYSSTSGAQLRGDLYTYTAGEWSGYESTITTSLQLAHDGTSWVPDNTIKYELVDTDYNLIADTYRDIAEYSSAVSNLETYGNISTFNWDEDQIDAAINTVLEENFPGMEEEQKFIVTVYVYDGSSHNTEIYYTLEDGVYVRY